MTFPIDFWKHEKVRRLSDAAFRAFVEMNGHSRERETDGVIGVEDAEFIWDASALQELCKSHPTRPLLYMDAETYVLRDYAEHQFTKADRDDLSEKRRKAAEKRWSNASAEQVQSKPMQADAEIGIGKEINPSSTKKGDAAKRGTRIPEPFIVTAAMRSEVATECPSLDIDQTTKQFVDYWRAASGRTATKKDWVAAWRFWMRKDYTDRGNRRLTPTERAQQTAAAGRQVAGLNVTSLDPKEITA